MVIIQYQIELDGENYSVINNVLYIEHEDVLGRKYWCCLLNEDGYEDYAFEFFKYLYQNLDDSEIPKEIFELYSDEIYWQILDDISNLLYLIEHIGIEREKLLARTKASLEQLKTVLSEDQFKDEKYTKELLKFIENL